MPLQIDQTSTLRLLLTLRSRTKGIVPTKRTRWTRLRGELLLWHTSVLTLQRLLLLLAVEGVVAGLCCLKSTHASCSCRVDECAWRGVLCRDTHVAHVAKGILTFAG